MQNFTRIILIVILWNITVTLQQDDGPRVFHVSMPEAWHTACEVCRVTKSLLLPELSDRPLFQDQLKETMQPGDFVWINAKQLTFVFTYRRKYLRLAYAYQNLTLQNCLCFDGKIYTLCGTGGARISWREAAVTCGSMGTWQVIQPSNVQSAVGLLKDEMPVWLQKYRNNILPETESELCMGLERQTDGSFADRVDNCSSKHSFFCVRGPDEYSPTLTRRSEPVSVVTGHGDHDNTSVHVDEHGRESNADNQDTARPGLVVGVVGGLAALLVVLLVGFGGRYVLRRYRLRQQYRKSRRRYNDRKTTLSSRSEAETRRDMSQPSVQRSGFTKTALIEGEYEKSYSTLQNDVVRQCKTRMMSDLRGRDSQAPLKPYHSMDGLNKEGDALQELDGYEDYNPQCTDLTLENGRLHVAGFPAPDQEMYENTRPVQQKTANIVKKANGRSQTIEDAATPALPGHKMKVHGVRSQRGDNYDDPRARVETYDIPPKRQKGRFRLQKNSNEKTSINMKAEQTQLLRTKEMVKDVATIDDLDTYENSSTPSVGRKEVNSIDDLDCYENYLLTKKEAQ